MKKDKQESSHLALISQIRDVVSRFDEGDDQISTVADVVDEVEKIISEHEKAYSGTAATDKLVKAIARFRKEQAYDNKLAGRGDMDAAGEQFMDVVEGMIA